MSQLRSCHKASVFGMVHRRAINLGSARRGVSSMPVQVEPTRAEIARGALDARNLEKAVRALHLNGLVVVKDVVPHHAIDLLNEKMVQDALVLQARGEDGPFNYNQGNLQLDPPPIAKYFIPSIFTNPIATQITSGILGPRPQWTFCSANAAMPAAPGAPPPERQPVHSDADFAHPAHPFALVVNVPLTKMAPANGSTELWLGTHQGGGGAAADDSGGVGQQLGAHGERASGRIDPRHLRARVAAGRPPVQPVVDKGSVVIRDLRLWHAGMPHRGTGAEARARVMLAMIHFAPWYRGRMRLQFGSSIAGILEEEERAGRLGLEVPVDWVSDEVALKAYMNRGFGNSYDFDQDD
ncbi:phytanoyl-CoA dioxygenase [Apiospora arundinis]|uniref:Phytanoyl-CoA dioxygenase n=1 Tax=Apiospora arundinis TaxID=335852 RepID=A0ABR2IE93_9PEZI